MAMKFMVRIHIKARGSLHLMTSTSLEAETLHGAKIKASRWLRKTHPFFQFANPQGAWDDVEYPNSDFRGCVRNYLTPHSYWWGVGGYRFNFAEVKLSWKEKIDGP